MDHVNSKCSALDCARRFAETIPPDVSASDDAEDKSAYGSGIDCLMMHRDVYHRSYSLNKMDKLSNASSLESCSENLEANGLNCFETCELAARYFSDSSSLVDSTSCSENSFEISHPSDRSKTSSHDMHCRIDVASSPPPPPLPPPPPPLQATIQVSKSPPASQTPLMTQADANFVVAPVVSDVHNGAQETPTIPDQVGDSFPQPHPSSCSSAPRPANSQSKRACEFGDDLSNLNSLMPQMDFDKLEQDLAKAAREREMRQRKIMSERVRQRLAMDSSSPLPRYRPSSFKRPLKSNLGARLQSSMNLQVIEPLFSVYCTALSSDVVFVLLIAQRDDDTDEQKENDGDGWRMVSKSVSTPNLKDPLTASSSPAGSVSSAPDSCRNASELRRLAKMQFDSENKDFHAQLERLRWETVLLLYRAKEAAHMQMEIEHQAKMT
ncbi:unnamed protein product [Soboliphyme baturini]|uniref:SCHIP-1 domain-containing protein n=1 Tax=Soboliphyme baturini TaxID=241478 RepID=A0A183IIN8_9BILA|nr:unnamed protein product [Soboliphyme baturini]